MSVEYLGSLTLGAVLPLPASGIAPIVPRLQAAAAGNLAAQNRLTANPPSFANMLSRANQILAAINALIASGLQPPTLSAQLSVLASALAALNAQLAPLLSMQTAFAAGGIAAYHYNGRADAFGAELGAQLTSGFPSGGGGALITDALVLAATTGAGWSAMQTLFKTAGP